MPGEYEPGKRQIVLHTSIDCDPHLTIASLIHWTTLDLLTQTDFALARHPEVLDMAVAITGLGILRARIELVESAPLFWDQSRWMVFARPYLNLRSLAHVHALVAHSRGQEKPGWLGTLPSNIQNDIVKSLKYLKKTGDTFFQPERLSPTIEERSDWLELVNGRSESDRLIGMFCVNGEDLEPMIVEQLQARDPAMIMQSLTKVRRNRLTSAALVDEILMLVEHADDHVKAKSVLTLADLGELNERSVDAVCKMLASRVGFVEHAAISALTSLESPPENVWDAVDRGIVRAAQSCRYDILTVYLQAIQHWGVDAESHLRGSLENEGPEILGVCLETLKAMHAESAEE